MKTGFFLVLSLVLFIGGLIIMGYAPTLTAWQGPVFVSGILCIALSFGLPIHVLTKLD